jgi:hypothetical protein
MGIKALASGHWVRWPRSAISELLRSDRRGRKVTYPKRVRVFRIFTSYFGYGFSSRKPDTAE